MPAIGSTTGSPPHVRGKAELQLNGLDAGGITPACAGKRWYTRCAKKLPPDHPRVCGEKGDLVSQGGNILGSPPHVRGKADERYIQKHLAGITPACAGKSSVKRSLSFWNWDHPRMCGEKSLRTAALRLCWGSPPHVRGKGAYVHVRRTVKGITPACAGKSFTAVKL